MLNFVDELEIANNAYRTKDFIVTQELTYRRNEIQGAALVSVDVFYKRTKERDVMYEKVFAKRWHLNGRRIRSSMYTRRYVE